MHRPIDLAVAVGIVTVSLAVSARIVGTVAAEASNFWAALTAVGTLVLAVLAAAATRAYWRQAEAGVANANASADNARVQAQKAIVDAVWRDLADAREKERTARAILDVARTTRGDADRLERGVRDWRAADGTVSRLQPGRLDLWRMTAHAQIKELARPQARHGLPEDLDGAVATLIRRFMDAEQRFFRSTERGMRDEDRDEGDTYRAGLKNARLLSAASDEVSARAEPHWRECERERQRIWDLYEEERQRLSDMARPQDPPADT